LGLWRNFSLANVRFRLFLASHCVPDFLPGYYLRICREIPNVRLNWSDVAVGGVVTSLLFIIGKQLLALYMRRTSLGSAYGAAGSLIVVLIWVYYSAQVFFFGAEFTKVYAETCGSQKGHSR
jgi:membrane protein